MARMLDGTTWLPIGVAAGRHGVSEDAVKMGIRRGKVAFHKLAGRIWVRADDVADLELANHRRRSHDTPA